MDTFFRLYFKTDQDKNVSLNVPGAKENVPGTVVKSAMNVFLGGDVVNKNGVFTEIRKAALIKRSIREFDVA